MVLVYLFHMVNNHYVLGREADECEIETKRLKETGKITESDAYKIIDDVVYYTNTFTSFSKPPRPKDGLYPYMVNGKWVLKEDKRTEEEKEICQEA